MENLTPPEPWNLYFPGVEYSSLVNSQPVNEIIELGTNYLSSSGAFNKSNNLRSIKAVHVEYESLQNALNSCNYAEMLREQPTVTLGCLGIAAFNIISNLTNNSNKINVRVFNCKRRTPIVNIKANTIGKFIQIRGTVIRVSNIQPMVWSMKFSCGRCESEVQLYFTDGKFSTPSKCSDPNCKNRHFQPLYSSAQTVDLQYIKVQEELSDGDESGRVPRTVECELTEDLVDSCVPGDVITLCGTVKCTSNDRTYRRQSEQMKTMYTLYVDVNSVRNSKQKNGGKMELQIDQRDYPLINAIASMEDTFKLIVNSICPMIYGHELVKAGLTLALFGGCQKYTEEKNKIAIRGDPHVLIVGDPGLGKSQMLTAVNQIAPRGVYICGSYSTASGLTVTLQKEKGTGDYAIEAGALVLGDQGICCIDEFDKMNQEHQSLLEAMEQQSISIAKAGIVCSLPARTSVIAAANPVGGHYNKGKTVCENLKISPAMLSRFDLIFILLDKPDHQKDEMLSEHVMALHAGVNYRKRKLNNQAGTPSSQLDDKDLVFQSLKERLKVEPEEFASQCVPPPLLRKYISYAKKWVHPKLTAEAASVFQQFYLSLRKNYKTADSTPITTRQLESLIRLGEARAKIDLREYVTEQDALEVVEIMKESLFQTFEDEYGNVDFRRGTGMSNAKESRRFLAALRRQAQLKGEELFTFVEMKEIASNIQLNMMTFKDLVESLNQQNCILKKGNQTYLLCR